MDKEYVMRVAATIREQLVTMTDTPVLMSWGIEEFMATVFNDLPGLKFHVNGRLFQGEVLICLNGSDYYEVYLQNGTDIECLSDEVCFDELGEVMTAILKAELTKRNMHVSVNRQPCRSNMKTRSPSIMLEGFLFNFQYYLYRLPF